MSHAVRRGLLCLTAFLLLFPLALGKPGVPPTLKADESAYYLMALSLAHDHDLRVEQRDVDRLYLEFPFKSEENLIVMTDDGWRTLYYGKPFVYPLLAAPFVLLAGANGMTFLNMLLTLGMVWMGAAYLRRDNEDSVAAIFSSGFFLLSAGFAYVFWLQPEVFNMAAVAACLFLGLRRPERPPRWPLLWAALSGAALAAAVYNKPMIAAVGLAPLAAWAGERRWRPAVAWLGGAVAALALTAGLAVALTGHATPYLGVQRQGISICEPGQLHLEVGEERKAAAAASPTGNAWSWLIRVPEVRAGELAENAGYFLWGRHTGLLLYFPFAGLALLLFLLHNRRSLAAWTLAAALAAVALFFLAFIPWNWQGGGGFVGNRYFVNVYPAFLFLVSRVRPRWTVVAGSAAGGLLLAPLLFTVLGPVGPEPTLQAHTRNLPYTWFPLELSLRNVPGYQRTVAGALNLIGRRDQVVPQDDQLWLRAGSPVELHLLSARPVERFTFAVASPAPGNRVGLEMGRARTGLTFAEAGAQHVTLAPGGPTRVRTVGSQRLWVYRLIVTASDGRIRTWTRHYPPPSCRYFAWNEKTEESFFLGAALTYLGSGEVLDAPLFALAWSRVEAPGQVAAGAPFSIPVEIVNRSPVAWIADGAARVRLSYHWRDEEGAMVVFDGARTDLPLPLAPGAAAALAQRVVAPPVPGRYVLELDAVLENVAWFAERGGGTTRRQPIEVLPAAPPAVPGAPSPPVPGKGR